VTVSTTRAVIVDVKVVVTDPHGATPYSPDLKARAVSSTTPFALHDTLALESTDPAGVYGMGVTVIHTGTGKVLLEKPSAAQFTVTGTATPDAGPVDGDGGTTTGPCQGGDVFCDDYTRPELANAHTLQKGTWTRGSGVFTGIDSVVWERARALLGGDYTDFDSTLAVSSLGDSGFGLSYAAQATDDGFAVIVHPVQFQGVYLKRLNPGEQDDNLASYALPAQAAGKSMTLRVKRSGMNVAVWLDGTQILNASDGGSTAHGRLGLIVSTTDKPSNAGAKFTLLRLESATPYGTCTPSCSGKQCGSDGCGGTCAPGCSEGQTCSAAGTCQTLGVLVASVSDVHAGKSGVQPKVAALVKSWNPDYVVMAGDFTYNGTTSEFSTFDGWFGSLKSQILPAPGNHEYYTSGAPNYGSYWGSRVGTQGKYWYSVDLPNNWHVVSLDGNVSVSTSSEQYKWFDADLTKAAGKHILAVWHQARWSSDDEHPDDSTYSPLMKRLVATGKAELVINGHSHSYQRYQRVSDTGADPKGPVEIISATGGYSWKGWGSDMPSFEVYRQNTDFGALKLTLHASSWDFSFVNLNGTVMDSGTITCPP
jgi:predicted phosphodiesterase